MRLRTKNRGTTAHTRLRTPPAPNPTHLPKASPQPKMENRTGGPKKKTTDNKAINFLRKLYPHLKEDDIKLMSEINTTDELKAYAKGLGWADKDIKKEL